jgi:methylated-DNA-[protein]-cysteine S-methyltransferase
VRAELTRYSVPGWGAGELWARDGVVLAHDFAFNPVSCNPVCNPVSDTDADGVSVPLLTDLPGRAGTRSGSACNEADSTCGETDTHLRRVSLDTNRCLTPNELVERFAAFLAGKDVGLEDVAIDLDWATPFQHAVATALRSVRRGEVVSYGELAALAGYSGAARAAGTFCARNRFMLILPCHRVVGATGIGGYGSAGPQTKRRLLALEGVVL